MIRFALHRAPETLAAPPFAWAAAVPRYVWMPEESEALRGARVDRIRQYIRAAALKHAQHALDRIPNADDVREMRAKLRRCPGYCRTRVPKGRRHEHRRCLSHHRSSG